MGIDIGPEAINRSDTSVSGNTYIELTNPANATGMLTSFEIYASSKMSGVKVGTFYGSSSSYTARDYETIGDVGAGSKQTFTGKTCEVSSGDYIGIYYSGGTIESSVSGYSGAYGKGGDQFGAGTQTYTLYDGDADSCYGTGIHIATVTTQEESAVTSTSLTGNGNITDTGGFGSDVTRRGFCYMEGDSGDPTTANSTVYDDGTFGTGAFTKSITGLTPDTSYRIRAYAVNAAGTAYGATVQAETGTSLSFVSYAVIF